jgi:hypothetical protein
MLRAEGLAACAASIEPRSAKFPDKQGKYREYFAGFARELPKPAKFSRQSNILGRIPGAK